MTEMAVQTWTLVNPTPGALAEPTPIVVGERHRGRRLGMLSNRKPNATVIGRELLRLAEKTGIASEVNVYEKLEGPGVGCVPELLDRIAEECDAVIVGSAD
jgi:hypothetical protein